MLHFLFTVLTRIIPAKEVFAHCDIPCGIYTTEPALTAAKTVVRMTELIQQLEPPSIANFNAETAKGKLNSLVRYITVKEQHAQKCKEELLILWTDYFKPEHLEMFPALHETFWKVAKLCSKVKQEVNMEAARELEKAVQEIADIFEKSHKH
ncbi:MAG: superoxide dismutase, Ni [Candidatus Wildermuthbacteria bacterium]|nr:superoxide dismutase, Ni [Candidatus Wildermuthbacteria bacterium]